MLQNSFSEPIGFEFGSEITDPDPVVRFPKSDISLNARISFDKFFAHLCRISFRKIPGIKKYLNAKAFEAVNFCSNARILLNKTLNAWIANDFYSAFVFPKLGKSLQKVKSKKKNECKSHSTSKICKTLNTKKMRL